METQISRPARSPRGHRARLRDGIGLHRIDRLEADVSRTDLAVRGAGAWFNMTFRDNFCHADPHPGNLLINVRDMD